MSPAEVVIARLQAVGAVTALVGTRIYQLKLPQSPTLPAIRVQEIDVIDRHHLRGREQLVRTRVQVDAFVAESSGADPLATVHTLADAIHGDGNGPNASGLDGWIGEIGSPPVAKVLGVFRKDRADSYEADVLRVVRTRQDYMVHLM